MDNAKNEDLILRTYTLFMEIFQRATKHSDRQLRQSNRVKTATYLALQALIVNEGVMSHTKLAEWTNTRKHNITGLVARMKKQGLVTTEYSPIDKRLIPITITDKGRKLYETSGVTYQDIVKKTMHGITRDKAKELERLLKVVKSNLEQQSQ